MAKVTRTLIIRHDADFRGFIETDAACNGYDAEATIQAYLNEVERLALEELGVDDVDVERIDAGGATQRSAIEYSDWSEMTFQEANSLLFIEDRALIAALNSVESY